MSAPEPRPYVVVDTETTGLDPQLDHVWELSARRYAADGTHEQSVHMFVQHDAQRAVDGLPDSFLADHIARYDEAQAWPVAVVASVLDHLFRGAPTLVGASVQFDARFLSKLLGGATPWHYRLRCVTSMAHGYLGVDPGGLSDTLAALRLPANTAPHTAHADMEAAALVYRYLVGHDGAAPDPIGIRR